MVKPLEFSENWKSFGNPKIKHVGKQCIYARPTVDKTDGFFVAIFERQLNPDNNGENHQHEINIGPEKNSNFNENNIRSTNEHLESSLNENSKELGSPSNKKKKRKRLENVAEEPEAIEPTTDNLPIEYEKKKKKKKRLDEDTTEKLLDEDTKEITEDQLNAQDSDSHMIKKKRKNKRKLNEEVAQESASENQLNNENSTENKKKKKKKKNNKDKE